MRWIVLGAVQMSAFTLAACGEAPDEETAKENAQAVAEVEAHQDPPPEVLTPEIIKYPDMEKHEIYGAGCSFVPEGGGLGAIAIGMADEGYMKLGGEILVFAADKGSPELPYLARQKYDGLKYSFTLQLEQGNPANEGKEVVDFPARLTVNDGGGRAVYQSAGMAQCGA